MDLMCRKVFWSLVIFWFPSNRLDNEPFLIWPQRYIGKPCFLTYRDCVLSLSTANHLDKKQYCRFKNIQFRCVSSNRNFHEYLSSGSSICNTVFLRTISVFFSYHARLSVSFRRNQSSISNISLLPFHQQCYRCTVPDTISHQLLSKILIEKHMCKFNFFTTGANRAMRLTHQLNRQLFAPMVFIIRWHFLIIQSMNF